MAKPFKHERYILDLAQQSFYTARSYVPLKKHAAVNLSGVFVKGNLKPYLQVMIYLLVKLVELVK